MIARWQEYILFLRHLTIQSSFIVKTSSRKSRVFFFYFFKLSNVVTASKVDLIQSLVQGTNDAVKLLQPPVQLDR